MATDRAKCASGDTGPYDSSKGGITCAGCGRWFQGFRSFNAHVSAARRAVDAKRCLVHSVVGLRCVAGRGHAEMHIDVNGNRWEPIGSIKGH